MKGPLVVAIRTFGHYFRRPLRNRRERRLIETLFDRDFYLRKYPDVAAAKVDPMTHYLSDGWREGRWPSGNFDTAFYLREHPDVVESDQNPLVHYVLHGRAEKRATVERSWVNVSRSSDILQRFEAIRSTASRSSS